MKTLILVGVVAAMLAASAADANAKGGHGGSQHAGQQSGKSHTASNSPHAGTSVQKRRSVPGVQRDSHGRIARSQKAKHEFKHSHPCPSTGKSSGACPGYVIDHVVPLKRGGMDHPSNMQWQTRAAAKEKDGRE